MTLEIGDKIPDLQLPASGGREIKLREFKGRKLVVYFYPKDNTPGCTQEGQDFRDLYKDFQKAGADIVGVSKDSLRSHENFIEKFGFPFPLIADTEQKACDAFGAIVEKSMYGKKYMGIDRCTWLFDGKGVLRQCWRSVKVKGHAADVLEAVKAL
ncbi:MAG: peroxiredoxin [Nevskiaceae bacterium]|nr:MAG: peroxiredoxin [Nevskiaceae bacterium]